MSAAIAGSKRFLVHKTVDAMRAARKALDPSLKVGFVPTMGALHEGHLSLMRKAASENDVVVASIFVNPTQFGPNEDLDRYPRTWERDQQMLQEINAIDMLFAPSKMYSEDSIMFVDPAGSYFDSLPEAKIRPGHFRGVATIVTKLFHIVKPDRAYFGQKDAAQCVLIRRLVKDLDMDISVVIGGTVRETDGLAMSSRNAYLSPEERPKACVLHQSLEAAKNCYQNYTSHGESSNSLTIGRLKQEVESVLKSEPLVKEIEYIAIDDYDTMKPLESDQTIVPEQSMIISLACRIGQVRLIDNIVLSPSST